MALSSNTAKKEQCFHLIEWTTKPYTLQFSTKVFGVKKKVAAGQVVCEGVFWSRVDHLADWYKPQENTPRRRPKKILVLLSHILCGKVCFKSYQRGQFVPPTQARVSLYNRPFLSKLIWLGVEELDFIQSEQQQREGSELIAMEKIPAPQKKDSKKGKKGKGTKRKAAEEEEEGAMDDEEYIDPGWQQY